MKCRKRFWELKLPAAALAFVIALPATCSGQVTPAVVVPGSEISTAPETTADDISVGGKTLHQWRSIFGVEQTPGDGDTIFSQPVAVPSGESNGPSISAPAAPVQTAGREAVAEIIRKTQQAYWMRMSVIADNLANADTVGYKRNCTLLDTRTDFSQGRLKKTGRMLDIAIQGQGLLQVKDQGGKNTFYTRAGNLLFDANGNLTVSSGTKNWIIEPAIHIPQDAVAIVFEPDGSVAVKRPGSVSMSRIGQLTLAVFLNPDGLQRLGGTLFGKTSAAGCPILATPGHESIGVIRQGHLECSNVDFDAELDNWNATAERIKILSRMLPQ